MKYIKFGIDNTFVNKKGNVLVIKDITYPIGSWVSIPKDIHDSHIEIKYVITNDTGIGVNYELNQEEFIKFLKENKYKLVPRIRTLEEWDTGLHGDFDDYVSINDYVDEEMAQRFVECVAGGYWDDKYAQCGESDSEVDGYFTYTTFKKVKNSEYWKYIGLKFNKYGKKEGRVGWRSITHYPKG